MGRTLIAAAILVVGMLVFLRWVPANRGNYAEVEKNMTSEPMFNKVSLVQTK